jgi:peptide deformylase
MTEVLLPEGWHAPSADTLRQYVSNAELGIVSPSDPALSTRCEEVADPTDNEASRLIDRIHTTIMSLHERGSRPVGFAANQLGESARIMLVPQQEGDIDPQYGTLMPVINPVIEQVEAPGSITVPHGCFSQTADIYARTATAGRHILKGFNHHGDAIALPRKGFAAVVDTHELWHLDGLRSPDMQIRRRPEDGNLTSDGELIRVAQQLDYRPEEDLHDYRDFVAHWSNGSPGEWRARYLDRQWAALKIGEFSLEAYL